MQWAKYFVDLQVGIDSRNAAPQNDEERQEIFNLKRNIVLALVQKVTIDRDRELTVHFNLDILRILQDQADKQDVETNSSGGITAVQTQLDGTYIRKRSSRVRRRRCASCASPSRR